MTSKQDWFRYLCAQLEPMALEPQQSGQFSYTVAPGVVKMSPWAYRCNMGGALLEIRESRTGWFFLSGMTITGIQSDSYLSVVNPDLADFGDDTEGLYYDRLTQLAAMPNKSVGGIGSGVGGKPLLAGPYGSIVTQYTFLDYAWLGTHNVGANEIDDNVRQRFGHQLGFVPIRKGTRADGVTMLPSTGNGWGLRYVILPASWSCVADSTVYRFRDDFMGSSLDLGLWTRVQSATGNIDIDPQFQWVKVKGNGAWGGNGFYLQQSFARASAPQLVVDINVPAGMGSAQGNANMVAGWNDGSGVNWTTFQHGVSFTSSNGGALMLSRFELGVSTPFNSSVWTEGNTYRLRITPQATGATYEIQGLPQWPALGGSTWAMLNCATQSGGTMANLYPAVIRHSSAGYAYAGDIRVL